MSKELEHVLKAYNQVEEFISEMPLSYKGYNTLGASEYISERLNEIEEALNEYVELKQALTPPTAEEVCKVLSEQLKTSIKIGKNKHGVTFNYVNTGKTLISVNYDLINITVQLPPHLITLIGRFYQKGEEK